MKNNKRILVNDIINEISNNIERFIREIIGNRDVNNNVIKNALLLSYINKLIDKGEYFSNGYLLEIKNTIDLYDLNVKNNRIENYVIKKIEDNINLNINTLIFNYKKQKEMKPSLVKKYKIETYFHNKNDGVHSILTNNGYYYCYINEGEGVYISIYSIDNIVKFFNTKSDLVSDVIINLKNIDKLETLKVNSYQKYEFINNYYYRSDWIVNKDFMLNEWVESIKKQGEGELDDNYTLRMIESNKSKSVFIIKNKEKKRETILHIYSDSIELSINIAMQYYKEADDGIETIFSQKENKWIKTKISKNNRYIEFNQDSDFIIPMRNIMEYISILGTAESTYEFSHDEAIGGLCYGLSMNYLLEIRNNGVEYGTNYIIWLKKCAELLYFNTKNKKIKALENILINNEVEYNLMRLMEETKKIFYSQSSQFSHYDDYWRVRKYKEYLDLYIYDPREMFNNKEVSFSQYIYSMGLTLKERRESTIDDFLNIIMDNIINKKNYYSHIQTEVHNIAFSLKVYTEKEYFLSLFDANLGVFEFYHFDDFKDKFKWLLSNYKPIIRKGKKYIGIVECEENSNPFYQTKWSESLAEKNKNLVENLKKIGFSLEFKDNIKGKVIELIDENTLIFEILDNNRSIEVSIESNSINETILYIQKNIDKITHDKSINKMIVGKDSDGEAIITPTLINFPSVRENNRGYIDFQDNYFENLININKDLAIGQSKIRLSAILSNLKILNGNIYFNKIVASIELLKIIPDYIKQYENSSVNEILNKIYKKLESKIFNYFVNINKDNFLSIASKNSSVAARIYQIIVSETNGSYFGISDFIYNNIKSNFLLNNRSSVDKINYKNYYFMLEKENIKNIIDGISIEYIKDGFFIISNDKVYTNITYNQLNNNREDPAINYLLEVIENQLDKKIIYKDKTYNEIYISTYSTQDYKDFLLQKEISELESIYKEDNDAEYFPNRFYIEEEDPEKLINKSIELYISELDTHNVLFEYDEKIIKYLLDNKNIILNNDISHVFIDIFPTDLNQEIRFFNITGVKNELINNLFKKYPQLEEFISFCKDKKIKFTMISYEESEGVFGKIVKKKKEIEYVYDTLYENTIPSEKIIYIGKKENIYNSIYSEQFIEGIAQKINVPVYKISNDKIMLSTEGTLLYSDPVDAKNIINKIINDFILNEVVTEKSISSIEKNKKYHRVYHANKIYKKINSIYPDYRKDNDFLFGYRNKIVNFINDFSSHMTENDIFNYIEKNKYNLKMEELGALLREIDNRVLSLEELGKQRKRFVQLFNKVQKKGMVDSKASSVSFPQKIVLSKLKEGGEGFCESLSMLFAGVKYFEHQGNQQSGQLFLKKLAWLIDFFDADINKQKIINNELELNESTKNLLSILQELSRGNLSLSSITEGIKQETHELTLSSVFHRLFNNKNTSSNYLQLYTKDHALFVWGNKNNSNYGLYDPNFGLAEFSEENKFKHYLTEFFHGDDINAKKIYKLEKIKSDDFLFDKILNINAEALINFKFKNGKSMREFITEPLDLHKLDIMTNPNKDFERRITNEMLIDETRIIQLAIPSEIIDGIIYHKFSIDYSVYKYYDELSKLFHSDSHEDIKNKLIEIINDPLVSKRFNRFVINDVDQNNFMNIFDNKVHDLFNKDKIVSIKILISSINDDPRVIKKLSENSKQILSDFFSLSGDELIGEILRIVSTQEKYLYTINQLDMMVFYSLSTNFNDANQKINETTDLKKITTQFIADLNKQEKNSYHTFQKKLLNLPQYFSFSGNENFSSLILFNYLSSEIRDKVERIDHLSMIEELYYKNSIDNINSHEEHYLSLFETLLSTLSESKDLKENIKHLNYGILDEIIIELKPGNYLLDIDHEKINLTINTSPEGMIRFDVFINKVGSIKIIGHDKNKITSDLLNLINNISYKNRIEGNKTVGSIYHISEFDTKSISLFNKFALMGKEIKLDLDNKYTIKIDNIEINKKILSSLGCYVNDVPILKTDLKAFSLKNEKVTFYADKLNDFFLSASGSDDDNAIISLLKKQLNQKEKNITSILSPDINRMDYLAAKERLAKIIELNEVDVNKNYWDKLRYPTLKIPRYMKIISGIGYGNITFGMWQSISSTLNMMDLLKDNSLSEDQRKEISANLAIMWTEMTYNGLSEIIEIAVAKGMLKHRTNALEYAGKMSTRVGMALNLLSVGFDIYNMYDNFSRISSESNARKRDDYIVNGTFAIVSALATIGVSIAILAGSTVAGPIGIVVGAAVALITTIYNAVRVVEDAKNKVSFTVWEEIESGFLAAFTGKIAAKKQNEITLLDTKNYLRISTEEASQSYHQQLVKYNPNSQYFYTNEEYRYKAKNYYKVVFELFKDPTGLLIPPMVTFIAENQAELMSKEEAEKISSLSSHLVLKKTKYQYFEPQEAISTDETLIFDLDFYIHQLKKYTIEIVPQKGDARHLEMIDDEFLNKITMTENKILPLKKDLNKELHCVNNQQVYYYQFKENEDFYFNTKNGNDIIAAPKNAKNTFDIYNGTKRLSGGIKDDIFNLYTTKSPQFASRFYGREGNDTLCIAEKSKIHSGYEVNLLANFVKFTHVLNPSNSLNFGSKIYLYHDKKTQTRAPKVIVDTMPNIKLQSHEVIAYLDSIENVIGSDKGNDLLVGNNQDNYLDGVSGNDTIYGHQGNDVIRLVEGIAEGGDGEDTYIIALAPKHYSDRKKINITLFENIENKSNSVVKLEHYFNDIKKITRDKEDLIIEVNNKIILSDKENKIIPTFIRLKNVYKNITSTEVNHHYNLITDDGFMLTINDNLMPNNNVLFNFSYLENYSKRKEKMTHFYLDEVKKQLIATFSNYNEAYSLLPELKYSGIALGQVISFTLEGSADDNTYFSVTPNSTIKLSNGQDAYQLKTFIANIEGEHIDIVINSSNFDKSKESSANIILSDVSGYELKLDNGILSHRYNPNGHLYLDINEMLLKNNLFQNLTFRIIDKDSKVFSLPNKYKENGLLVPIVPDVFEISSGDDNLVIQNNIIFNKFLRNGSDVYQHNTEPSLLSQAFKQQDIPNIELLPIIDVFEGNDIVINHNEASSVISGGAGDDILIVEKGHHILLAEEGNDKLYGGEGNDLLISDKGHDYLNGSVGNDIYVVAQREGNVVIMDNQGHNRVFITGVDKNKPLISSREGDDEIFRSQDNQFTLTIKDQYFKSLPSCQVEQKAKEVDSVNLSAIIYEMAQFNQTQLSSMVGGQLPSTPNWSLLPVIINHLN